MRVLAGDIGGTKTWLGLFEDGRELREAALPSAEYDGLGEAVAEFLGGERVDAAAFGIAGPVQGRVVRTTNLPWVIDADALEAAHALGPVRLLNDFHALALGLDRLGEGARVVLQEGEVDPGGPVVVIGAGTGLGKAVIVPTGEAEPRVLSSEGGHRDFAPRDALDAELLTWLRAELGGRVSVERVVSGLGLASLYRFLVEEGHAEGALEAPDGAEIAAARETDLAARMALERFVSLYGAEAGNLALEVLAKGGLYVAGGIAPKLHDDLGEGFGVRFLEAFADKGRMRPLLEKTRVTLVTEPKVGLLGAARAAGATPG
ncbi:MAG TPA: glucokinase [Polyangiaceae bacterium LLY-WYZ-15_(1-7)]|nr:glucokinase [Myxococcales bacterium]MAT26257.1 glucokinase [Sandaracinus sp.]HJK89482.1 glucokinase [Polyangiaceae bacterium LLY-WYZ-15_(1-7)]HJL03480.1 glucokinase [Polyangiaceae bacterium LLY-WYZ-15_(1-7)]HJL09595.1 glucokinase [Polyangiaceae bacterium LLY-WYZ-15_(1-7)]